MLLRIWNSRSSHSLLVGMRHGTATSEDSLVVFYKTKQSLPYNSAIALVIYPNELKMISKYLKIKSYLHKTCTWMFTAVLFIVAKTWSQPRCFSVGEWISKLPYPDNGTLYSNKRNELSSHERHGETLNAYGYVKEASLQRNQPEIIHTVWFHLYGILEKAKLWRQ